MRFLFGLVAGALATLFVAAALDAPADRIVEQLVDASNRVGKVFTEMRETPEPDDAPFATFTEAEPLPAAERLPEKLAGELSEPLAFADEAEPTMIPEAEPALPAAPEEAPRLAEPPGDASSLPTETELAGVQQAVAWGPFHSEASASGYARRLSRETGRDFLVEKRAPANYAVVFSYVDDDDLAAMQAQIAAVTGMAQP